MRINLTLDFGPAVRTLIRFERDLTPGTDHCTVDGLASRWHCIEWLTEKLIAAEAQQLKVMRFERATLAVINHEAQGIARAVEYLRAQGKSEEEVREWCHLQLARVQFPPRVRLTE